MALNLRRDELTFIRIEARLNGSDIVALGVVDFDLSDFKQGSDRSIFRACAAHARSQVKSGLPAWFHLESG